MHLSLDMSSSAKQFTMEHVLRSIHYHRCYGYLELVAIINTLPDFITKHNKVVWMGREGEVRREWGEGCTKVCADC